MRTPLLALATALIAAGCGGGTDSDSKKSAAESSPYEKVSLKRADDSLVGKLKPRKDGFKVVSGADDTELGKISVEPDRVKLKGPDDVGRWKVKTKDDGAEIETDAGERLFRVRWKSEKWQLEDADKNDVAEVKVKDDGSYELRDAAGATLCKAKPRDGKVAIETESGDRIFDVKGSADALAAVWLGYEPFALEERAALWAWFEFVRPH